MLQLGNRIRRPHVLFAGTRKRVFTTSIERIAPITGSLAVALLMAERNASSAYFDVRRIPSIWSAVP